jgi:N-acetylneuraminic acid mutarotase
MTQRIFSVLWLSSSLFCLSFSQTDTAGHWFSRAPLPTARQEVAHAVIGGKIYVPGGLGSGGIGSTIVEVFDPQANSWSTASPLPEPLHHLGLAAVNGKLYVLGGYVGNTFTSTDRVYEYNPDSNLWRQKTSMPVRRGAHVAIAHSGKIYVIGGVRGGTATGRTDVYDPVFDSWDSVATMPTAREHLAGTAIDSLIYIVGGRVGSTNTNKLEAYSPASNTWYTLASMPTARGGLATATLNGKLYAFGGEISGVYEENEEYNPAINTWRTMAPMPTPRHGIGAAAVGDSIFIIGGATVQGFGVTDANEFFTLISTTNIEDEITGSPSAFTLSQNYPNPFNASTTIRFTLPYTSNVTLRIYSLLGVVVGTHTSQTMPRGTHFWKWNAEKFASGIYYYRIQAGRYTETKKLLLVK